MARAEKLPFLPRRTGLRGLRTHPGAADPSRGAGGGVRRWGREGRGEGAVPGIAWQCSEGGPGL